MDYNLNQIKTDVYDKCGFKILDFEIELESKEYCACRFSNIKLLRCFFEAADYYCLYLLRRISWAVGFRMDPAHRIY